MLYQLPYINVHYTNVPYSQLSTIIAFISG